MTANIIHLKRVPFHPVLPLRVARPRSPLSDMFEAGQDVFWIVDPPEHTDLEELRVPAEVTHVTSRRVKIRVRYNDGYEVEFYVRPEKLRVRCTVCQFLAAMPGSHVCAGCWTWDLVEAAEEADQHGA